jgi:MYXO-CTERM domain-containing protein
MTCAADGCRHLVPSPGALGAACATWRDCVDGECFVEDGAAAGVCARRCVALGEDACPAGYLCTYTSGVDFFCLAEPEPQGGCGCASTPDGGLALAILVLVAGLRARSRRTTKQP